MSGMLNYFLINPFTITEELQHIQCYTICYHLQLLAEGTVWVLPAAVVNELHISPLLP